MTPPQIKIKKLVDAYIKLFPNEYREVVSVIKEKRNRKLSSDTGIHDFKGLDVLERELLEYPENLWTIFNAQLNPEELLYLTSRKGAIWFGRTFKVFSLVNKI